VVSDRGAARTRPRQISPPWLVAALLLAATASLAAPGDGVELDDVLSRLDRVAMLYRSNALRFACEETIVHLEYIYVHTEERGLEDYRVPLEVAEKSRRAAEKQEKKKKKRNQKGKKKEKKKQSEKTDEEPLDLSAQAADLSEYGLPTYLRRAFSWIFLFEKSHQSYYRYELGETDTVLERPAIQVRFEPLQPFYRGVNDWFGTAWVDAETFQILRVEAWDLLEYRKQQRFERSLEEASRSPKRTRSSHTVMRVVTEYEVIKNGMRFPSEVNSRNSRYVVWSKKGNSGFQDNQLYSLKQSYDNYRFFGVQMTAEIDRVLYVDSDGQ
jgi:hypothetical protein